MSERPRLLVVEDDPEVRYVLEAVLSGGDREIVSAATGADARRHLEGGGIDLVGLDLILPAHAPAAHL